MTSQQQAPETIYARTNREIFRPAENTGNPQYDFFTHYARLSGLARLSLESHTVNGTQISRYEPDITHSTTCVKAPGLVTTLRARAAELLSGAILVLTLGTSAPTFAAPCVRSALHCFDLEAVETAQTLLSTDVSAPAYPAIVNQFAAATGARPRVAELQAVDHSLEVKIAAPVYAARELGNAEDAAEFIRSLRLIAGQGASSLYLQQLASHYYAEAKRRPTCDVLKEMGLLALEMSAVTASSEQLEFGDDEVESSTAAGDINRSAAQAFDEAACAQLPLSERRTRWLEHAARVLGEREQNEGTRLIADELQAQSRLVYRKGASGFAYDEFAEYLSEVSAATDDDAEFGAYLTSCERVYEQYDEGFAVSLHMTDTDRKIACGDLADDVDSDSLPECARHLADVLHRLYTSGKPLYDRGAQPGVGGVTLTAGARDPQTRAGARARHRSRH